MAGGKGLSERGLNILTRIERDLALLKNEGYFTDEQWIQLDFIIHQGTYVLSAGPKKTLVDFYEPLDASNHNERGMEKYPVGEDINLLLSYGSESPMSSSIMTTKSCSKDAARTESPAASWTSQKTESEAENLASNENSMESPTAGLVTPRWDSNASDRHAQWDEAENTTSVQSPATDWSENMPDPEALAKAENHEYNAAREWEDDEETVQQPSQSPESRSMEKTHSSAPENFGNRRRDGMSDEAAKVVAEIHTDWENKAKTDIRHATVTHGNPNTAPPKHSNGQRVCNFWATGKVCRFQNNCIFLHRWPDRAESPSWRQQKTNRNWKQPREPKQGGVNSKLAAYKDPKTNLISTLKDETCWFWATPGKECPNEESKCVFAHHHTGKIQTTPWWEEINDDGAASGNASTTPGERHGSDSNELRHEDGVSRSDDAVDSKATQDVGHGAMGMQVDLGGNEDEEIELESGGGAQEIRNAAIKTGWGDEVNLAVKAPSSKNQVLSSGIFGASAGGWGDDLEQTGTGNGWNTVPTTKGGKESKCEVDW